MSSNRKIHNTGRGLTSEESIALSADAKSSWFCMWPRDNASIEVEWSGLDASDGTWHVETTNVVDPIASTSGNAFLDATSNVYYIVADEAANSWMFHVESSAKYVRLVWTANSVTEGSGVIRFASKNRGR